MPEEDLVAFCQGIYEEFGLSKRMLGFGIDGE